MSIIKFKHLFLTFILLFCFILNFGFLSAEPPIDPVVKALKWDGDPTEHPTSVYYHYYDSGHNIQFNVENVHPEATSVTADFSDFDLSDSVEATQIGETNTWNFDIKWEDGSGNNVSMGIHQIDINMNFPGETPSITISPFILVNINPKDIEGVGLDGATTDWSDRPDMFDFTNAFSLVFEKSDHGKLTIDGPINLTDQSTAESLANLGEHLTIAAKEMALNPSALDAFQGSASIEMYGFDSLLPGTEPSISYIPDYYGEPGEPVLLVNNGEILTVTDYEGRISEFNFYDANNTLSFDVSEWSGYQANTPVASLSMDEEEKEITLNVGANIGSSSGAVQIGAGYYNTDGAFFLIKLYDSEDNLLIFDDIFDEFSVGAMTYDDREHTSYRNLADFKGVPQSDNGTTIYGTKVFEGSAEAGTLRDTALNGALFYAVMFDENNLGFVGHIFTEGTEITLPFDYKEKDSALGNYRMDLEFYAPYRPGEVGSGAGYHTFEELNNLEILASTSLELTFEEPNPTDNPVNIEINQQGDGSNTFVVNVDYPDSLENINENYAVDALIELSEGHDLNGATVKWYYSGGLGGPNATYNIETNDALSVWLSSFVDAPVEQGNAILKSENDKSYEWTFVIEDVAAKEFEITAKSVAALPETFDSDGIVLGEATESFAITVIKEGDYSIATQNYQTTDVGVGEGTTYFWNAIWNSEGTFKTGLDEEVQGGLLANVEDTNVVEIKANDFNAVFNSGSPTPAGFQMVIDNLPEGATRYGFIGDLNDLSYSYSGGTGTQFNDANVVVMNFIRFGGAPDWNYIGPRSSETQNLVILNDAGDVLEVRKIKLNTTIVFDENNSSVNVDDPENPVNVDVNENVDDPEINLESLITDGTGDIPKITINSSNANNVLVQIPQTTITSEDTTWNGVLKAPRITTISDLEAPSGKERSSSVIIQLGFSSSKLTFDHSVRILIPGESGKRVGYTREGEGFTEITTVCDEDSQSWADSNLGSDGDCKINVGDDLVIWTKHFTTFATFTESNIPSSGTTYTSTTSFFITEHNLNQGYNRWLYKDYSLRFNINNKQHRLEVKEISGNNVTITISSTPQTRILSMGEEWKVNLNNDNKYDLLVTVEDLEVTRALISVKRIDEVIVDTLVDDTVDDPVDDPVDTPVDVPEPFVPIDSTDPEPIETIEPIDSEPLIPPVDEEVEEGYNWTWIIAIVLLIIIILMAVMINNKKSKRKGLRRKHL